MKWVNPKRFRKASQHGPHIEKPREFQQALMGFLRSSE
jgi:hypothetical protein